MSNEGDKPFWENKPSPKPQPAPEMPKQSQSTRHAANAARGERPPTLDPRHGHGIICQAFFNYLTMSFPADFNNPERISQMVQEVEITVSSATYHLVDRLKPYCTCEGCEADRKKQ